MPINGPSYQRATTTPPRPSTWIGGKFFATKPSRRHPCFTAAMAFFAASIVWYFFSAVDGKTMRSKIQGPKKAASKSYFWKVAFQCRNYHSGWPQLAGFLDSLTWLFWVLWPFDFWFIIAISAHHYDHNGHRYHDHYYHHQYHCHHYYQHYCWSRRHHHCHHHCDHHNLSSS